MDRCTVARLHPGKTRLYASVFMSLWLNAMRLFTIDRAEDWKRFRSHVVNGLRQQRRHHQVLRHHQSVKDSLQRGLSGMSTYPNVSHL
jgi:hypothetical protein